MGSVVSVSQHLAIYDASVQKSLIESNYTWLTCTIDFYYLTGQRHRKPNTIFTMVTPTNTTYYIEAKNISKT